MKIVLIIASMLGLVACGGCSSSRMAPAPDIPPEPVLEHVPASSIALPVHLAYKTLLALTHIEELVPREDDHNGSWREVPAEGSGNGIKYRWVREPFTLSGKDSTLTLSTVVAFQVRYARRVKQPWPFTNYTWVSLGSCGYEEPMRRARFTLASNISMGEPLRLRTVSRASVQLLDPCEVSVAGFDVTGRLQELFSRGLAQAAGDLDARVAASSHLEERLREVWKQLQRPVLLAPDSQLALRVHPRSLALAAPEFSDSSVSFGFNIIANPEILPSSNPASADDTILVVQRDSIRSGFSVLVRIQLDDSSASRLLESRLAGKEFSFPSGQRVAVRAVRVSGNGAKMIVGIRFSGQFDGELFFSGKPEFDFATQSLWIPDFDYDLKTRDWLVSAEEWLQHKEFVGTLKPFVRWNLAKPLAATRTRVEEALNMEIGKGMWLEGSVTGTRVAGFQRTNNGIGAVAVFEGSATVSSRP